MEDDWWCITKNGKIDINPDFKEGMEEIKKKIRLDNNRIFWIYVILIVLWFLASGVWFLVSGCSPPDIR